MLNIQNEYSFQKKKYKNKKRINQEIKENEWVEVLAEVSGIHRRDAVLSDDWIPAFRSIALPSSSRVKWSKKSAWLRKKSIRTIRNVGALSPNNTR